jgi:hypothetical protein
LIGQHPSEQQLATPAGQQPTQLALGLPQLQAPQQWFFLLHEQLAPHLQSSQHLHLAAPVATAAAAPQGSQPAVHGLGAQDETPHWIDPNDCTGCEVAAQPGQAAEPQPAGQASGQGAATSLQHFGAGIGSGSAAVASWARATPAVTASAST